MHSPLLPAVVEVNEIKRHAVKINNYEFKTEV